LAFVNNAPKFVGDYPGTNFAAHCASDVYSLNGTATKLLSGCSLISSDIKYCQDHGKKVLLSVGGVYNDDYASEWGYSNYTLSNNETGVWFADFLFGAFGPKNETWKGPRPFDFEYDGATVEVSVDGFDFDIEKKFGKLNIEIYTLSLCSGALRITPANTYQTTRVLTSSVSTAFTP
jgi:chitinase